MDTTQVETGLGVGKTALVTGSRRGIGLGIAKKLAEMGYTLYLSATGAEQEVAPLLEELNGQYGNRFSYIRCDITHREQRAAILDRIWEERGALDLLVNNAGVAPKQRLDILETTEESFDRLLNTNLKSTFFFCQLAAKRMIAHKQLHTDYTPRIVNISSISAYTSSTSRGEYCISKAGISMTTQLFADRLAEYGIPVFEVRPGIILTDMTAPVQEKYQHLIEEEGVTPIRRFGYPEDVANCVAAAASGLLDFSTGQVLNADGGFHIRRL